MFCKDHNQLIMASFCSTSVSTFCGSLKLRGIKYGVRELYR